MGTCSTTLQPVALQADHLFGVVGHQAHLADAQVHQDLGPDAVVAQVRLEPQLLVGLDGVLAPGPAGRRP